MSDAWPWLAPLGLGAFHGINPGMGWLFAVAPGLQEQRRSAVWNALPPIAVGHALSAGLVVALVALIHASIFSHACVGSQRQCSSSLAPIGLFVHDIPDGWGCVWALAISRYGRS